MLSVPRPRIFPEIPVFLRTLGILPAENPAAASAAYSAPDEPSASPLETKNPPPAGSFPASEMLPITCQAAAKWYQVSGIRANKRRSKSVFGGLRTADFSRDRWLQNGCLIRNRQPQESWGTLGS
jgi:hypothetical protein